jgi:hypothetical protein
MEKSLKDRAAEKLGLDSNNSSIKDVQAAMLGLDPQSSSMFDVDNAKAKLSQDEQLRIDYLLVDQEDLLVDKEEM